MNYKITSKSEVDTMEIAQNIESEKFPGMIICLNGELGSGKTIFAKGFAQALGIVDNITSPTFNLVKEYNTGEMPLFHMDIYRLKDSDQSVGFNDYFNQNAICLIEWADLIAKYLPKERLEIRFVIVDENTRILVFTPYGKKYEDLCEAVL